MGRRRDVGAYWPSLIVAALSGFFSIGGVLISKYGKSAVPTEVAELQSQNQILTTLIAELRTENLGLRQQIQELSKPKKRRRRKKAKQPGRDSPAS